MKTQSQKIQRLTVGGVFIALSTILSMITLYRLPFGGSVTLFSMIPIMLVAYIFGPRFGMLCGGVYGVVQSIIGAAVNSAFAGQSFAGVLLILFFDYIAAFSSLALAGAFRNVIKNKSLGFALGAAVASLARFVCHVISGVILFGGWAEWYFSQDGFALGATILGRFDGLTLSLIYSIFYNGSFMLFESIISVIAASVLMKVKPIRQNADKFSKKQFGNEQ